MTTGRQPLFDRSASDRWPRRSPGRAEQELDITPMIDVTFLLLIFFMVTSTMKGNPDVDVPVARFGKGIEPSSSTIIDIRATGLNRPDRAAGADSVQILLNGLERSLEEVPAFVAQGMESGRFHVIVRAERDVPHRTVREVVRRVGSVEGASFSIGVQDKPAGP